LSQPAEWAIYTVIAALKFALDESATLTYVTPDEAKHSILKTLNWFEAHDEYEWPDFSDRNYDFAQVMRLRRALVQDVFNALQQANQVKTGVPDSVTVVRRGDRSHGEGGRRINTRKRLCKREADSEVDTMSEHSKGKDEDDPFLLQVMVELAARSKVDVGERMLCVRDPHELADVMHDRLVEVWDQPLQESDDQCETLRQKADLWERHRRSVPPKSTQRERTPTTRASPVAPQASPGTVQKPSAGSTSTSRLCWDDPRGYRPATEDWADVHSIG
ncbi:hypothetical protein EJ07DRAFT_141031, partial [Lizonia empirigonia]